MIKIDGSLGEGGGQVLRSALSLSLVTKKPFEIINIRKGRKKSGLLRQHLTAVKAAKEISNAKVEGDVMGSTHLTFSPGETLARSYHFSVGTAGSANLVLQTILPPLMLVDGVSDIIIEGGTHNPYAPTVDFLQNSFLPILNTMGVDVSVELERFGFYPAGGGQIKARIKGCQKLQSIDILERGQVKAIHVKSYIANLDVNIAKRELKAIQKYMPDCESIFEVVPVENALGPGNVLTVELKYENMTEVITGFGQVDKSAEKVASESAASVKNYMASGVPVGGYLADQLMIPFALAGSGSYKTFSLSRHSQTNLDVIKIFIDIDIDVIKVDDRQYVVKFGT